MASIYNTLQLIVSTHNHLRRNWSKLSIEDIVAICIADKHTRIVLHITLGNYDLCTLNIQNNRRKGKASSIYLIDWQILVSVLKRCKVLILLCTSKVIVGNPTVIRLCKVEGHNLILNGKLRAAICNKAVGHTVVICTELDSRAVCKLNLQSVVVILNSTLEVELRSNTLTMAVV